MLLYVEREREATFRLKLSSMWKVKDHRIAVSNFQDISRLVYNFKIKKTQIAVVSSKPEGFFDQNNYRDDAQIFCSFSLFKSPLFRHNLRKQHQCRYKRRKFIHRNAPFAIGLWLRLTEENKVSLTFQSHISVPSSNLTFQFHSPIPHSNSNSTFQPTLHRQRVKGFNQQLKDKLEYSDTSNKL